MNTLPFLTKMWSEELLMKFKAAAGEKEIGKVIEIINKTRPVAVRIQVEGEKEEAV